jgi:hypothetical protein
VQLWSFVVARIVMASVGELICDGSSPLWSSVKSFVAAFVVSVALSATAYQVFTKLLWNGLWVPLRYRRIMAKQGVKGPPFRFLSGQMLEVNAYRESFSEVVPLDSYADLSPTVTPLYALFFPKFPGTSRWFLRIEGVELLRDAVA